ncbi:MAG: tetratricopeptide repeat protein [Ectothiorhodospiraceae bacterium]|nr:tetratricopeptide repeat protein [Ectothiorhodospiraceae bacterium]
MTGDQPCPLSVMQAAYSAWLESRHVPDPALQRALNQYAARRDPPLVLVGSVDGRLSSRLARWVTRYRSAHNDVPVFVHHFGAGRHGRRPQVVLRRLLAWIRDTYALREPVPATPAAAGEVLPNWLARAAAAGRLVLVLDGLDDQEGLMDDSGPDWLPAFVPDNLRLVVTMRPGPAAEAMRQRGWRLEYVDEPHADDPGDSLVRLPAGQADMVCALWAARNGLASDDVQELGLDAGVPGSLVYHAGPRLCLAGSAVQDAAARRLMPDGLDRQAWHALLARWYREKLPDDAALTELVWQLTEAGDWTSLARLLTDPESLGPLLRPTARETLLDAWMAWGADRELVDYYVQAAGHWSSLSGPEFVRLGLELLGALRQLGLDEGLEPLFRGIMARDRNAAVCSAYGAWLLDQQRPDEAKPLLADAVEGLGGPHGDAPALRTARHRLAMALEHQGHLDEAEALYRSALEGREAVHGAKHVELLPHLNNLAAVKKARQDYEGARLLYQRALSLAERHYGQRHPTTAACLDNLAGLLYAGQDLAAAEDLYQRALGVAETAFGPHHPATAASAHNLGTVMDAREQFQAAESLFRRAVEIRERVLGTDHMDTASSLHNLAGALDAMGRYDQAEPLYRRALSTWEHLLGREHPATATTANNLADLLREKGEWEEAEALYRRNLDTWTRLLGDKHPHAVMTRAELAALHADRNDLDAAEPLLRQALEETREVMGAGHPQHIACVTRLAALLRDTGRRADAAALLQQALKRAEGTLGLMAPAVQKLRRHLDALDVASDRLH